MDNRACEENGTEARTTEKRASLQAARLKNVLRVWNPVFPSISMLNICLMEILIKKPCHEDWSGMTPNEQGAFCSKCVKTVVDFSHQSLDEIRSFFTGRSEEKVCGRFEEKQLAALSFDAFFEQFRRFEFTKRLAVILFFTFGVWLFGASSASAQNNEHIKGDVVVEERTERENRKEEAAGKLNGTTPNTAETKCHASATYTHQPQSYKMGKVVPVKEVPAKDPGKPTPVKQKPVKQKPQEPIKPGEVMAPLPADNVVPKP